MEVTSVSCLNKVQSGLQRILMSSFVHPEWCVFDTEMIKEAERQRRHGATGLE